MSDLTRVAFISIIAVICVFNGGCDEDPIWTVVFKTDPLSLNFVVDKHCVVPENTTESPDGAITVTPLHTEPFDFDESSANSLCYYANAYLVGDESDVGFFDDHSILKLFKAKRVRRDYGGTAWVAPYHGMPFGENQIEDVVASLHAYHPSGQYYDVGLIEDMKKNYYSGGIARVGTVIGRVNAIPGQCFLFNLSYLVDNSYERSGRIMLHEIGHLSGCGHHHSYPNVNSNEYYGPDRNPCLMATKALSGIILKEVRRANGNRQHEVDLITNYIPWSNLMELFLSSSPDN